MRPQADEVTESGVGALVVGDLGVVFQPIVEVATGRVFAHEALGGVAGSVAAMPGGFDGLTAPSCLLADLTGIRTLNC